MPEALLPQALVTLTPMAKTGSSSWGTQIAVIVVGVIVLVGGIYAFLEWQRSAPSTPVHDIRVQVTAGDTTQELAPYTVCPLDEQCDGGDPPTFAVGDEQALTLTVPEEISSSGWRLLTIYDDPAANDEHVFQSHETREQTVDAVTDSGARLVVAEVSALEIDKGEDGEEFPVLATWSVALDG